MLHLFAVILLAGGTWARFSCPPAEQIYPCECSMFPRMVVQCDDVYSLASIRANLEDHFAETIPRLDFSNVHSFALPTRALGNLHPRRFVLKDSDIRRIEKDAFEGQKSLGLLMLTGDRLEDIPAEALQQLTSLQTLSLYGNFLMRIPDGSLNVLDGLRFLVISDNRITEIGKKAFPKNLVTLAISKNLLGTFNGSLQSLEYLEDLFASDNRLTSLRGEFDGLSNLKLLDLSRNHISDISDSFINLTSLTSLSLSGNRIQEVGKSLTSLGKLEHLNLSYNYITDLHWRLFEKLKDLKYLDLSGNFLKAICPTIKPLRSLNELRLSDLGLKSLLPDCFYNMKSLNTLDLSHNRLTNIDTVSRHPLPALMHLRLGHNELTAFRYGMKYAKNLKELDISFNKFISMKPHYLSYNKELNELNMEGNPWECTEQTMLMLRDLEARNIELQGRPDC